MPILIPTTGGKSAPIPSGTHQATCYGVVSVGTLPNELYAPKPKVLIFFELPHERADFGEVKNAPRTISKRYTLSFHKKSGLRADIQSWKGKQMSDDELTKFDLVQLIGSNCLINIQHVIKGDKTYGNIAAISPLAKGMGKEPMISPRLYFNLVEAIEVAKKTRELVDFGIMPDWLANTIKKAHEYTEFVGGTGAKPEPTENQKANVASVDIDSEDVPF